MKSVFAATVLAAASSALAIQLFVQSDSSEVDGDGVSSIHEGAAIDYVFLGKASQDFTFSQANSSLSIDLGAGVPFPGELGVASAGAPVLLFQPGPNGNQWSFDASGTLQLNGSSDGFFACKNINDPNGLSATEFFVTFYGTAQPPSSEDCDAITLTSSGSANSTAPAAETSAAEAPAAESTAPAVSETNDARKLTAGVAVALAGAAALLL